VETASAHLMPFMIGDPRQLERFPVDMGRNRSTCAGSVAANCVAGLLRHAGAD
jgi:hypothetical protein